MGLDVNACTALHVPGESTSSCEIYSLHVAGGTWSTRTDPPTGAKNSPYHTLQSRHTVASLHAP
jgi:hypothetical protein